MIEIALGIVLAVVILYFLVPILVGTLWLVLGAIVLSIAALVIIFISKEPSLIVVLIIGVLAIGLSASYNKKREKQKKMETVMEMTRSAIERAKLESPEERNSSKWGLDTTLRTNHYGEEIIQAANEEWNRVFEKDYKVWGHSGWEEKPSDAD